MLDVPSLQNYYFLKIHQEVLKNRENNVFITKYACFIHDREKKWKLVPQLPLSEIGKKKHIYCLLWSKPYFLCKKTHPLSTIYLKGEGKDLNIEITTDTYHVWYIARKGRFNVKRTFSTSKRLLWKNFFYVREQSIAFYLYNIPTRIYQLKLNNRNIRIRCKIYSKFTMKTPERRRWLLIT